MGDVKVKVDHAKLKSNKYGDVEHETAGEPFKPAYTMTSERSAGYLSRMHGRCAQNFGSQSEEQRIAQVPEFCTRMLADIQKIASEHDDYDNLPMMARLEVRQKMSLAI